MRIHVLKGESECDFALFSVFLYIFMLWILLFYYIIKNCSFSLYQSLSSTETHNGTQPKSYILFELFVTFCMHFSARCSREQEDFFTLLSLSDFFKLNFLEMNFCDYFLNSVLLLSLSKLIKFFLLLSWVCLIVD